MKIQMNIIKYSEKYLIFSIFMIVISLGIIFTKGLNYGIDFSGGNLLQIKYVDKKVTLNEINDNLDKVSKEVEQASSKSRKVQISEDGTIIIRIQEISEAEKSKILKNLKELGEYNLEKEEKVGASIGKELKKSAIYSLLIGSLLIVIYITFRFQFSFALGGILSLLHDIIISIGFISLLGYEINTPFIAAILTILGYSINDTIVIYDRIRENLRRRKKNMSLEECMDNSVNQVVVRSINTSLTTLFSIIAILIFGGDSLRTFIVTLLVGVLVGTYSSLFIATPLVYYINKRKKNDMSDMLKKDDEKEEKIEKILV